MKGHLHAPHTDGPRQMLFLVGFVTFPGEGIGCLLCKQPPHELLMQFIWDLHAIHEWSISIPEILQTSIVSILIHG